LLARLDASFEKAVEVLFACKGESSFSGMGKSGLIGAENFLDVVEHRHSILFPAPAEALHGDLGMLARGDAMLAVPTAEKQKRSSGFWRR